MGLVFRTADPDVDAVRFLPAPASRIVPLLGRVHYLGTSLYRAFDTSGYGILAQLLDFIGTTSASMNTYKVPVSGELVSRAAAYDRLAARLEESAHRQAGRNRAVTQQQSAGGSRADRAGAEVTIALPTAEELLAEVLSLRVQDDAASPVLSVDRLGDGYRSLLRLAIVPHVCRPRGRRSPGSLFS